MQKKVLLPLMLLLGAGLSCDMNGTRPATTGSIGIVLLTPSGASFMANARESGGTTSDLKPIDALASVALTSARLVVTGPTTKTVTSTTAGANGFVLRADGLTPGTYAVVVEGLASGQVAHFGTATGITVTAGQETPANVTFPVFQPQIPNATVEDTSDVLRFTVTWNEVQNATGYIVDWSQSPTMSNASSKAVTGAASTSTEVTVTTEGKYYFTVKAVNPVVVSGGLASVAKSVFVFQGVATVTVTPPTPAVAPGGTVQLAAEGRDADNNVVSNVTWFWASSNHTVATVNQSGLVTGVGGGSATITAVGKGMPGSVSLAVNALPASKLGFSIQPADAIAGDAISPAIQVEVQDANGVRISDSRDPVTITFATNAGGGTLRGTRQVNAINGIASFTGLWIDKSASGYTLSATSGSLTGATSSAFAIAPAAPAKLAFSQAPSNVQGNVAIAPAVTVTITDQFDNATSATNNVTVNLGDNPWKTPFAPGAVLAGTQTRAAFNGVATFDDIRVDKPAPGYSLLATAGSLASATSSLFNTNLTISQLVTGGNHTCAISIGGSYCFGNNGSGQLGAFLTVGGRDSIAALVRGGLTFVSLTAGNNHSCGLTAAGAAYCWGNNGSGQLGNNSTTASPVPVAVAGGHVFASIDAGGSHTCGITTASGTAEEDRQVYCWGSNGNGQIGDGQALGTTTQYLTPSRVINPLQTTTRAAQVSAGGSHTCVRTIDSPSAAYCWGFNEVGQLGNNTVLTGGFGGISTATPQLVFGGYNWVSISAGGNHTCGIRFNHASSQPVMCFGYNWAGQLGNNTLTQSSVPVEASGLLWIDVTAGGDHSCALLSGGAAYCWGTNGSGQLGDEATTGNISIPVAVNGGLTFASVRGGNAHTCGRTSGGVYCWGSNTSGQLGSPGANTVKRVPTQIIQ